MNDHRYVRLFNETILLVTGEVTVALAVRHFVLGITCRIDVTGVSACSSYPINLFLRRENAMKLTRHNGRVGKNGTFNPKHNDRCFNVENSEHIDRRRRGGRLQKSSGDRHRDRQGRNAKRGFEGRCRV